MAAAASPTAQRENTTSKRLLGVLRDFWGSYSENTPRRLKVIDVFLAYALATGLVQLLYVALVGQFPFNSFLAGLLSSVGFFVLTVGLRLQINNKSEFHNISEQRAFADFIVCNLILHFVVVTFIG